MKIYILGLLCTTAALAACAAKSGAFDWAAYRPPDWRRYQARNAEPHHSPAAPSPLRSRENVRVTFGDLKNESDASLSRRLLGAVGQRIAYVDRHKDRWRLYRDDAAAAESIDLYTHPNALGSKYGLCGVEKYSLEFGDDGRVSAVSVTQRYGVEGPVFQKKDFDWTYYGRVMCASAPASHAPSYFPADDSGAAQDLAMLLLPAIDLAASPGPLPFRLTCRDGAARSCDAHIRTYLGALRLEDIDASSPNNCPLPNGPKEVCFTIIVGKNKLGPFPKTITVKGSTYLNNIRVTSVEVEEDFTVS